MFHILEEANGSEWRAENYGPKATLFGLSNVSVS